MERDGVAVHTLTRKKKNEGKLAQDSATLLAWVANHNIEFGSSFPLTEIAMQ